MKEAYFKYKRSTVEKKLSFPEAHFKHVLNFQFCQKYTLSTKKVYLKYTSCKGQFRKGSLYPLG